MTKLRRNVRRFVTDGRWRQMISMAPAPSLAQLGEIARIVRDIALVLAIVSYFSGWIYVNSFLQPLGLRLGDYEQPVYHIILYSFVPIVEAIYHPTMHMFWWGQVLLLLVSPLLILRLATTAKALSLYALVLYGVALVVVLFQQANVVGRAHADSLRNGGGKTILLTLKDDYQQKATSDRFIRDLIEASDKKMLRLIWRTKDATYVLRLFDNGHSLRAVETYEVRNDQLLLTTVLQPSGFK